jgi:DNA modification methylase
MTLEYRIGDVFERMAEIPDGSIDLIVTSPPFLALRSYLPADHPDKAKEIGSEPTPAEFIDTMLALSAEWGRVLAPHGSLCVELGDTYSGSGGGGGDYLPGGLREDQPGFGGSAEKQREGNAAHWRAKNAQRDAWPLAKSMTGIPQLYELGLSYGRNLLTGEPSPAGQWRVRNRICWARPNPPVGALGDKFRPATSYITVACKGTKRYFDLDAVRTTPTHDPSTYTGNGYTKGNPSGEGESNAMAGNPAGAPPLDWHADDHPEDGDWLWKLSTQPYKGSHYATFPMALPKRLIEAMCPQRVCVECGKPSERIAHTSNAIGEAVGRKSWRNDPDNIGAGHTGDITRSISSAPTAERVTTGWTDCGHDDNWRTGVVLDPFGGSGTTAEAAQAVGRHAICIDLDERNAELARERVGMFLEVVA